MLTRGFATQGTVTKRPSATETAVSALGLGILEPAPPLDLPSQQIFNERLLGARPCTQPSPHPQPSPSLPISRPTPDPPLSALTPALPWGRAEGGPYAARSAPSPSGGAWLSPGLVGLHPAHPSRYCWATLPCPACGRLWTRRPLAAASRAHALPLEHPPAGSTHSSALPALTEVAGLAPRDFLRVAQGFPRRCPKARHVLQLRTWSSLIKHHQCLIIPPPFAGLQSDTRPLGSKRGG